MASTLQTALVTGAGSGIGRGIAATLAEMGLRVALVGRDREKLERARAGLARGRDSAFVAPCDISDRFAVKAVVDQVLTAFEHIDVLVCNAGTNVK
ncbi:MAG TPA: SDR family NAD(P)-dependent oxidoreductase, partial [Isosphaeraceae bacterium]|nr:SDR family NAD(P)-dependent oxidoreductase [Isosphaeraceae bacterium]